MMIRTWKPLNNTLVKHFMIILFCVGLIAVQGCSIQHTADSLSGSYVDVSPDSTGNIGYPAESKSPDISAQLSPQPTVDRSAQPSLQPAVDSSAQPSSQPTGDSSVQPPLLTQYMQRSGVTFSEISFSQLILVAASGSDATVYCYDKSDTGIWTANSDIGFVSGHVGKNGVSDSKCEGDGCTPIGLYPLGFAFGISPKPDTAMEYKPITDTCYWVDDPDSTHYNEWVEGNENADWDSAEKLWEHTSSYVYAIVIEYNMDPIVSGKGSAIFFHCGERPTIGCVSVPQQKVLQILKWLAPEKEPNIFIVMA